MADLSTPSPRFRLRRMSGRDPHAGHRAATPLELLFDLSFVVAFSVAGNQFAHLVAIGYIAEAILGMSFSVFAICWAWINFTWFASAYDTDDWFYRVTTMVQMTGVIVLALGLPALFHSLEVGESVDNRVLVAGYVIMRIALVVQWLRVARQDPERRSVALSYVYFVSIAQVGWVILAVLNLSIPFTIVGSILLFALEFSGPVFAERKGGGTPWHPHHIAERYGLFTIITLGEGVLGTVTAVSVLVDHEGWSSEAILVVVAGIGITFAIWWTYFVMPSGELLKRHRYRAFGWGYGHILIFGSIAAVGAGLHVVAYVVEGEATIGVVGGILAVAIPVALVIIALVVIYTYTMGSLDVFHIILFLASLATLTLAVALAAGGASLGLSLIIITIAPVIPVVGFETIGHRHQEAQLAKSLA